MDIEGIINVTGKPGLHKIISNSKNSIIVESLLDKKRIPIYPHNPANALEEIAIYTYEDTISLIDVFTNIAKKENCNQCISPKSSLEDLTNYFREIVPNFDESRVYISDIKKVFQWYNALQKAGLVKLPDKKRKKDNDKDKDTD